MKKGAGLLLGGNRPEGDTTHHVAENLSIEMSATTQSSPLSAMIVNPSAEAIFWTTFILLDTVARMPMQAARGIKRASRVLVCIAGHGELAAPVPSQCIAPWHRQLAGRD